MLALMLSVSVSTSNGCGSSPKRLAVVTSVPDRKSLPLSRSNRVSVRDTEGNLPSPGRQRALREERPEAVACPLDRTEPRIKAISEASRGRTDRERRKVHEERPQIVSLDARVAAESVTKSPVWTD